MSDSARELLLGHLLDALEDSQQEQVELRLKSDPKFRREADRLGDQLKALQVLRHEYEPPPGLAERTCRFVAAEAESAALPDSRPRPMSPEGSPPSWRNRIGWLDVAMAAGIFIVAFTLTIPAIQHSRSSAQIADCKDNLRKIGQDLADYSDTHDGFFPRVPAKGKQAAAGIYAMILREAGLLADARRIICPGSSLAGRSTLKIPSRRELQTASGEKLRQLLAEMGGSYGYTFGHMRDGIYYATKNQRRPRFALMADAPNSERQNHQSLNHNGRGHNVLYEDFHVDFEGSAMPNSLADHIYLNDNGVRAAGLHENDSVIGPSMAPPIIYVDNGN